jgi:prepilin-type N-terminal cleavage/methylation domain-containing protein
MNNQKGFTIIELLVVLAMTVILGMIVVGVVSGSGNNFSIGLNGVSETRCIDGYKFIIGAGGQARQILNDQGGGIHCQ